MDKLYKIVYAQQAMDDLDAIFDYVRLENPDAAQKLLSQFRTKIEKLAASPYIGAALRTDDSLLISSGYRYLVVAPYLVFYRITENQVAVARILHSRQNWLYLLFGIH